MTVTSLVVWSKVPSPVESTRTDVDRPLAEVVVTLLSIVEPLAAESVTVSLRMPSAPIDVTSVVVRLNVPSPEASTFVVFDKPLAEVVVTLPLASEPSGLRFETLSVVVPSVPVTIVSDRVVVPSPVPSVVMVSVWRSALSSVVERDSRVPSALVVATVSVWLPSALSTVTSLIDRSKVPLPVESTCVVLDRLSAERVVTLWPISVSSADRVETVSVELPSALTTVWSTILRSKVPSPVESIRVVFDNPLGPAVLTLALASDPSGL